MMVRYWYGTWYADEDCVVVTDTSAASVPSGVPDGVMKWYQEHFYATWMMAVSAFVLLCGVYSWCLVRRCGARTNTYGFVKSVEESDIEAEPINQEIQ